MWIPDEAVEAATGVEIGDLNETVEAPWHLQPEEARRVLEAALPHMKDATPLTLDAYQEQAKATAVYPAYAAFPYLFAGLAGEVGELSSIYAKWCRMDQAFLNMSGLRAELGDVLWFVAMLAHELGYDLSTVAANNLDKLADRANRGKLKGNGDNR